VLQLIKIKIEEKIIANINEDRLPVFNKNKQ
jgi:hypothetical protein